MNAELGAQSRPFGRLAWIFPSCTPFHGTLAFTNLYWAFMDWCLLIGAIGPAFSGRTCCARQKAGGEIRGGPPTARIVSETQDASSAMGGFSLDLRPLTFWDSLILLLYVPKRVNP